jgi:hypothetical protein
MRVGLGERDLPADAKRAAFDLERPTVGSDRGEEADLDLDRGVAGPGGEQCVDGTAGR